MKYFIIAEQVNTFNTNHLLKNSVLLVICSRLMYFQKQGAFSTMCAVHAVNNLLGGQIYSQKTFNQICSYLEKQRNSIGCKSPNKHYMGGDYDANVIIAALENYGLECSWMNSKDQFRYHYKQNTFLKGYILNVQLESNMAKKVLKLSGRHWICLKLENDIDFYLIDSKAQKPQKIQDIQSYINFMSQIGSAIFQVRKILYEEDFDLQNSLAIQQDIKNSKYHENQLNQPKNQPKNQAKHQQKQIQQNLSYDRGNILNCQKFQDCSKIGQRPQQLNNTANQDTLHVFEQSQQAQK